MIQLATDPNARNWRAAAAEAKENPLTPRRGRTGHAWPFISQTTDRPTAQQERKRTPTNTESGS